MRRSRACFAPKNGFARRRNLVSITFDAAVQDRHHARFVSVDVGDGLILDQVFEKQLKHFVQKRATRKRVKPDAGIDGELFRQLEIENITEEVPERALAQRLEPAGRDGRSAGRRQVELRPGLLDPAVENGELVRSAMQRQLEPTAQVRVSRGDQAGRVDYFRFFAHPPEPPLAFGKGFFDRVRGERCRRAEPMVECSLISIALAGEDSKCGEDNRAGKHLAVVQQIVTRIRESNRAAQPREQAGNKLRAPGEIARRRSELPRKAHALFIEQNRVLQPRARKSAVIQTHDERVRPSAMSAGQNVRHVQTTRAGTKCVDARFTRQRGQPGEDVDAAGVVFGDQELAHLGDACT